MLITINKLKIARGHEEGFQDQWRHRTSYLGSVAGFIRCNLLRGEETEYYTLYALYAEWLTEEDFKAWISSEEFRLAHANAARTTPQETFFEPPEMEAYIPVL